MCRYVLVEMEVATADSAAVSAKIADGAGMVKSSAVETLSLKAPGFNPCTYTVISWFSSGLP
jgi:hypothetical protein